MYGRWNHPPRSLSELNLSVKGQRKNWAKTYWAFTQRLRNAATAYVQCRSLKYCCLVHFRSSKYVGRARFSVVNGVYLYTFILSTSVRLGIGSETYTRTTYPSTSTRAFRSAGFGIGLGPASDGSRRHGLRRSENEYNLLDRFRARARGLERARRSPRVGRLHSGPAVVGPLSRTRPSNEMEKKKKKKINNNTTLTSSDRFHFYPDGYHARDSQTHTHAAWPGTELFCNSRVPRYDVYNTHSSSVCVYAHTRPTHTCDVIRALWSRPIFRRLPAGNQLSRVQRSSECTQRKRKTKNFQVLLYRRTRTVIGIVTILFYIECHRPASCYANLPLR